MKNQNEIVFKVGTQVRVKRDFQDICPLRTEILTVQHHEIGDPSVNGAPHIDNCLYTSAMIFVGPFGNWEIEEVSK